MAINGVGPSASYIHNQADFQIQQIVEQDSEPAVPAQQIDNLNKSVSVDTTVKESAPVVKNQADEDWRKLVEKANKALIGPQTTFEFKIHDVTKEIMVKVINKETKEVIREIPPEKILDVIAKLWEMAGLFVDERR